MRKRAFSDYLRDILNSIEEVEEFTAGMSYDKFVNDRKTVNAVIRSFHDYLLDTRNCLL
ncbi:MAG TPA: HepT-like ribonuclease domain-containing protein [Candidatus Hypogeohydataceae bacterium YC40]